MPKTNDKFITHRDSRDNSVTVVKKDTSYANKLDKGKRYWQKTSKKVEEKYNLSPLKSKTEKKINDNLANRVLTEEVRDNSTSFKLPYTQVTPGKWETKEK